MSESQDIEEVTTAVATGAQPDSKARRYDRQLRLWAASGQSALESSRVLVISASATSTSILKNLVLPGIGHFTILDPQKVSPIDAGNNFFLEGSESIGKSRASEAVRLLSELNDQVEGAADTRSVEDVLNKDPQWIKGFSVVIAHNLDLGTSERLSNLLWEQDDAPPLVLIKSAGFIAEFFVQFHDHCIIESHTETAPTLRIDKPFPALREKAMSTDFANMDPTDHGHVPYVIILVRALEEWKTSHDGSPPKTYAEKQQFKATILDMKRKFDEENFDEAVAQAYRCWTSSAAPSDVTNLFSLIPDPVPSNSPHAPFYHLLGALKAFVEKHDGMLPLTSTLADMKSDTTNYIELQRLYKARFEEEKEAFRVLLQDRLQEDVTIDSTMIDTFVKNAHHVKMLKGSKWGEFDKDKESFGNTLSSNPRAAATHLALSALTAHFAKNPSATNPPSPNGDTSSVTLDILTTEAQSIVGESVQLPNEFVEATGEIARAPTADLPNMAAFLGGLVAQEVIKMITKQYVPVNGYCVVDLVDTWTAVLP